MVRGLGRFYDDMKPEKFTRSEESLGHLKSEEKIREHEITREGDR